MAVAGSPNERRTGIGAQLANPDAALADRLLGPRGRRAPAPHGWTAFAGLGLLALLPVGLAITRLRFCLEHGWHGQVPFFRQCYTDLATSLESPGLGRGLAAFVSGEIRLDQPVLSAVAMSALGSLTAGDDLLTAQRWFIAGWAVLAALLLIGMTWAVALDRAHPLARPVALAASPVAALTVLLSPDVLGVGLCTFGLVAWGRRRPGLAGALLGAAVMARTYPALAVLAVALLACRAGRQGELARLWWGVLGGALVAASPALAAASPALAAEGALLGPYAAWWSAGTGLGSPWHVAALAGHPMQPPVATALAVTGWLVATILLGVLMLGTGRPPTLAAGLLVAVAVVLVTGKSFPVQSSLWLVPLAALAGVRWRDTLVWWAAEAAHFVAVWLFLSGTGNPSRGLPAGWYALFLLARVAAIVWLARVAWASPETRDETVLAGAGPVSPGAGCDAGIGASGGAGCDAGIGASPSAPAASDATRSSAAVTD